MARSKASSTRSRVDLNILPPNYRPLSPRWRYRTYGLALLILCEAVLAGLFLYNSLQQYNAAQMTLQNYNLLLERARQGVGRAARYQRELVEINAVKALVARANSQHLDWPALLGDLQATIPPTVAVPSVSAQLSAGTTGATISLQGSAPGSDAIGVFVTHLQASGHFTTVTLLSVAQNAAGATFSLSAVYMPHPAP